MKCFHNCENIKINNNVLNMELNDYEIIEKKLSTDEDNPSDTSDDDDKFMDIKNNFSLKYVLTDTITKLLSDKCHHLSIEEVIEKSLNKELIDTYGLDYLCYFCAKQYYLITKITKKM